MTYARRLLVMLIAAGLLLLGAGLALAEDQPAPAAKVLPSDVRITLPADKDHPFWPVAQAVPSQQISLDTVLAWCKEQINDTDLATKAWVARPGTTEFAKARQQFVRPMLYALRMLTEAGVPQAQPTDLPSVNGFDVFQSDPDYPTILRRHAEEMEARRQADLRLALWGLRSITVNNLAGYFSTPPADPETLRRLATEIVKDPKVVSELMQQVEANLHPKPAADPPAAAAK